MNRQNEPINEQMASMNELKCADEQYRRLHSGVFRFLNLIIFDASAQTYGNENSDVNKERVCMGKQRRCDKLLSNNQMKLNTF